MTTMFRIRFQMTAVLTGYVRDTKDACEWKTRHIREAKHWKTRRGAQQWLDARGGLQGAVIEEVS